MLRPKAEGLCGAVKKGASEEASAQLAEKALFQCDTYKVRKMGLSLQEETGQGIKHRRNSALGLVISSTSGNVLLQCALLQLIMLWIILHRRCKRKHITVVLIAIHATAPHDATIHGWILARVAGRHADRVALVNSMFVFWLKVWHYGCVVITHIVDLLNTMYCYEFHEI